MKINSRLWLNRLLSTATLLLAANSLQGEVIAASVNLQPFDSLLEEIQQINLDANFSEEIYYQLVLDISNFSEAQGINPDRISQIQRALLNQDQEQEQVVNGRELLENVVGSLSGLRLQGNGNGSFAPITINQAEGNNLFLGVYTFELSQESRDNRNQVPLEEIPITVLTEPNPSTGQGSINLVQPGLVGADIASDNINLVQRGLLGFNLPSGNAILVPPGLIGFTLNPENAAIGQPGLSEPSLGSGNIGIIQPGLFTAEASSLSRDARDLTNLVYDLRTKAYPEARILSAPKVELPNISQIRELDLNYIELDLTINVPIMPKVELATALGTDPRRELKTQQQEMIEEYQKRTDRLEERRDELFNNTLGKQLEEQQTNFQQQFQF